MREKIRMPVFGELHALGGERFQTTCCFSAISYIVMWQYDFEKKISYIYMPLFKISPFLTVIWSTQLGAHLS